MNLKIYLSSKFERQNEMLALAKHLEELQKIKITSRWVYGDYDKMSPKEGADRDLRDVDAADGILCFMENKNHGTGGRHVELGYAIAKCKYIWLVGKPEHVFHHLGGSRKVTTYPTVQAWMEHMGVGHKP